MKLGMVGLGKMGASMTLRLLRGGHEVVATDLAQAAVARVAQQGAEGARDLGTLLETLEPPRVLWLMLPAGGPTESVFSQALEHLAPDDIVVDGANSHWQDSRARAAQAEEAGVHFVDCGVSGGVWGLEEGYNLMVGAADEAFRALEPLFRTLAPENGYARVGPAGSGHFVKMVHNGIEYGDMQLIAETYDIMRRALSMNAHEIGEVFTRWNGGKLSSFLVEITGKVLKYVDPLTDKPLVDVIADQAAQKGTGRWTSQNSFELGTPIPVIDAAVVARSLSSFAGERQRASRVLFGPGSDSVPLPEPPNREKTIAALENALYVAKIASYAQGMALMRVASETYDWNIDLSEMARIWKAGCIIRAKLLDPIMRAFKDDPDLENLMLAPDFAELVNAGTPDLRRVLGTAITFGIPAPAMSAALSYIDTYRQPKLPANLIQGLRDYFGAHTYQRTDREGIFHTEWMTLTD